MMQLKHVRITLPFFIFALIIIILWRSLALHPNEIPSPFINKPAPAFSLAELFNTSKNTTHQDFIGHVSLVNVWATWCYACATEHEFLMQLSHYDNLMLYGLNYKDDLTAARKWLQTYGNPFKIIAFDQTGDVGIDWGVYGTPESFIVDKKGIIRYKYIGPLSDSVWQQKIKPLVDELQSEPL